MNKNIKKIGKAVAGSALLVGATLTGAAGLASAASGSQDLGDYPAPFVSDDGQVQSTVVVGESAKTIDVVGAVNIAGSLGNAAFTEEEQSVDVSGSFGWSAENGATLDTRNDDLYFGDSIQKVRQTVTEDHVDFLSTTEAFSGSDRQDIESYLYVGDQTVEFGNPGDTSGEEDPFLFVQNPTNPSVNKNSVNNLYQLQANFQEGVEFQDSSEDDNRNENVYDEEVTLFGEQFTVADESFKGDHVDQFVLYGSSQNADLRYEDETVSTTITIDGNEHTIEVDGVNTDGVIYRVDGGSWNQDMEGKTFTVDSQQVRISDVINKVDDQGTATFSIGSEQVILEDGQPVMVGTEEEDVDGTSVSLSGTNVANNNGDIDSNQVELSSVSVAVGAADADDNYVRAGEGFTDPVFEDVNFHFGGLNPDTTEGGDNVAEISFSTDGEETATASFSNREESATVGFYHDAGTDGSATLADRDGDAHVVREGASVTEDEYFTADAGDFAHVWEVTSIDRDTTASGDNSNDIADDDEATVELRDAVTGASVEVDLDSEYAFDGSVSSGNSDDYVGTEVIDGQTYKFALDGETGDQELRVAWGTNSAVSIDGTTDSDLNVGAETTVYAAQDADGQTAVAFYEPVTVTNDVELPSTESSSTQTQALTSGTSAAFTASGVDYSYGFTSVSAFTSDGSSGDTVAFNDPDADSSVSYDGKVLFADGSTQTFSGVSDTGSVTLNSGEVIGVALDTGSDDDDTITLNKDGSSQFSDTTNNVQSDNILRVVAGGDEVTTPSAVAMEPEDDSDAEHAYLVAPGTDTTDNEVEVSGEDAGSVLYPTTADSPQQLETDDDSYVAYDTYGAYSVDDRNNQGSFTLNVPYGQSTAGAAVTGQDGSVSADAGASGSVTSMSPTGWPDAAALDSDSNIGSLKSSDELILVGGPAVNALTQELANDNKTMTGSEYSQGTAMVQLVNDAFTQGQDALVVAGYAGEDTREAANYVANYADHQSEMTGKQTVELTTQQTQSAQ